MREPGSLHPAANRLLALGTAFVGGTVIIGAFGAHGLKDIILDYRETFQTGVLYQFIHSFGIILIGLLLWLEAINQRIAKLIALLFVLGILLFSGSLYAIAITKIKILGAITPFGGTAFIVGWFMLAVTFQRMTTNK